MKMQLIWGSTGRPRLELIPETDTEKALLGTLSGSTDEGTVNAEMTFSYSSDRPPYRKVLKIEIEL